MFMLCACDWPRLCTCKVLVTGHINDPDDEFRNMPYNTTALGKLRNVQMGVCVERDAELDCRPSCKRHL